MIPDDKAGSGYVIVNNADEDMNGTFELWYDNKNEERNMAWSGSLSIGKKTSGNNKSANITFTAPADAKEPDKYMLVFKGKIGAEEDAVAGKKVKLKRQRGGIISFAWGNTAAVTILDGSDTKTFLLTTSPNKYLLKAAFDEGTVDVVRLLTSPYSNNGQRIWNISTFNYDQKLGKYTETNKEEITRADLTFPINKDFEFSYVNTSSSGDWEEKIDYKGIITESPENLFDVTDFFVPLGQNVRVLKQETKGILISQPFPLKYNDYITFKAVRGCSGTYSETEEYIGGTFGDPSCRKYGSTNTSCGSESWDMSGYCYSDEIFAVGIQYFYWETCDGAVSAINEPVSVWISSSLDYNGYSKIINNPKLNAGSALWKVGYARPCLLFDSDARYVDGTLSGKILSDQLIIQSSSESVEKPITIEPMGRPLDSLPTLVLRQTGGYSLLQYQGTSNILNYSSFANVPSDKPILLNSKGSGFKIAFISNYNETYAILQVGTRYDEKTQDFSSISRAYIQIRPESVMDLMVEYE
ncbi:MAG: hypothetical protein M0Z67_14040 [Nitrospiraceae bacterium]|nr:hypothetical protein [Nitrospiraceae bacterium]